MSVFVRCLIATMILMVAGGGAFAATQQEIDAAIKRGTELLKARANQKMPNGGPVGADSGHGVGPTCLAGLAMLEGGVPVSDPALKTVTETIRRDSYSQTKTYQVSLCLLFLDRLGDPADVPLIQILAVRLLVGQSSVSGGWGYDCIAGGATNEQQLRAIKPLPGPPKLHPDVEKYWQSLGASRNGGLDDNSNTQFAIIAIWLSRKHGVPVENALDLIEKRFMSTQNRAGGWPYNGPLPGSPAGGDGPGTPSMYCAGLIGMATAVARREERRQKADAKKQPPKPDPATASKTNSDDPFFNPPQKTTPEPKKAPSRPPDERDMVIGRAFDGLGAIVAESAQAGRGALVIQEKGQHGVHDLYFLWSLERACVIYGMEKVGRVNWYEAGAHSLVITQAADGSWGGVANGYGIDVNTSFAVLFLCRSNLARDLSSKVQKETGTEMRAGAGPAGTEPKAGSANASTETKPPSAAPEVILPGAAGSEAATMAAELVRATDKDWPKVLNKLRDSRGGAYTEALLTAVNRLEGDRLKSAREALAERLTRMTADTLRKMAKSEEAELRRAAVLAMAMKDDKNHVPDLIEAVVDDEEIVVRAAKAGLKSLTGQDFGPAANANIGEKKLAADAWRNWWSKQKK